ncbi:MAG: 3-hydroxyacyl-CoA dehydrogenase [Candidatus Freyarchaeota archaeon]
MSEVSRVAVIGAGTMGSDVSLLFALSGCEVIVNDVSKDALSRLEGKCREALKELRQASVTKEDFESVWERVTLTEKLDDVRDVDFVFEAITEDLELKRRLFRRLDELPLSVVLATNTSSLTVTEISEGLKGAERVGGMHFSNPPALMPLVEVVKGEKTSTETVDAIVGVAEKIGKKPVVLTKDMRGFVLNRLLVSSGAEAMWSIHRGEITPEELDASFKAMGFPIGFAEAMDRIGLDVAATVVKYLHEAYGDRFLYPTGAFERLIKERRLGRKTGRGFYDWSRGPPSIEAKFSERYDVMRVIAVSVNEAFWIVKDGVADPETIDKVAKLGMLAPEGVCTLADTIGLDGVADILNKLYEKYRLELYRLCPLFEEYLKRGWTGKNAGRGFYEY